MAKTQKEIDDLNEDELKEVIGGNRSNNLPEGYIEVELGYICDNYQDSPKVPSFAHGKCEGCIHCERRERGWRTFFCFKNSKNLRYQ